LQIRFLEIAEIELVEAIQCYKREAPGTNEGSSA